MLTFILLPIIIILFESKNTYSKEFEIRVGAKLDVCCSLALDESNSLHLMKGSTRLAVLHKNELTESDWTLFVKDYPNFKLEKRDNTICLTKEQVSKKEENLEFSCAKLTGGFGATIASEVLRIKIFEELKFVITPSPIQTTNVGESLSVECEASGSPDLKILWRKENEGVITQGSNLANLDIKGVTAVMNGDKYTCEASISIPKDSPSAMIKQTVTLNVLFPPIIDVDMKTVHVDLGNKEIIRITVKGNPRPKLDCRLLNIDVDRIITISEQSPSTYIYQMEFDNVTLQQVGNYTCTAVNEKGTVKKFIPLILGPINLRILSTNQTAYANYYKLTWQVESKAKVFLSKIYIDEFESDIGSASQQRVLTATDLSAVMQLKGTTDNGWLYQYSHNIMNLTGNKLYKISLQMCRQEQCIEAENPAYVQTPVYNGKNNVVASEIQLAQQTGEYNPNGGHFSVTELNVLCLTVIHVVLVALLRDEC